MKRKFSIFHFILILLAILGLMVIYNFYQFNNLSDKVEIFSAEITEDTKNIGVIDDRYYYTKEGYFRAFNEKGMIYGFSSEEIANVLYGKVIYIAEKSGSIRAIDRAKGEDKDSIVLDKEVENIDFDGEDIIVYTKDSILILDDKLKIQKEIPELRNPVKFKRSGEDYSVIELNIDNGTIYSNYRLYRNEEVTFSLSSNSEIFINTFIADGINVLLTNRYLYFIQEDSIVDQKVIRALQAYDVKDNKLALVDDQELKIYDENFEVLEAKELGENAKEVSIRKSSVVVLGEENLILYQNFNTVKTPVSENLGIVDNDEAIYIKFVDRIEKVNAY